MHHYRISYAFSIFSVPHIALIAIIRRLILHPALIGDLLPCRHQLVPQDLNVFYGLHETMSEREDEEEELKCHSTVK